MHTILSFFLSFIHSFILSVCCSQCHLSTPVVDVHTLWAAGAVWLPGRLVNKAGSLLFWRPWLILLWDVADSSARISCEPASKSMLPLPAICNQQAMEWQNGQPHVARTLSPQLEEAARPKLDVETCPGVGI